MQREYMLLWHPQCQVSEWCQNFHNILHNGLFILCQEEWQGSSVLWMPQQLAGEFTWLVDLLKQLQSQNSQWLHIHHRSYPNAEYHSFLGNEHGSITQSQRNQHSQHSLVYECHFQDFQNVLKYVHSQWSWLSLFTWPTPCSFQHCALDKVYDSDTRPCRRSFQIDDRTDGLPKTSCCHLHCDGSWRYILPSVWCTPCTVCGSSMQHTRFCRLQQLISYPESLYNLRKHYQLQFQVSTSQ
jgi:hypothetical protein